MRLHRFGHIGQTCGVSDSKSQALEDTRLSISVNVLWQSRDERRDGLL
ncbi:hypothetical protein [Helicobacter suis]|nr:hypothetical protein [Helicobacter suis]